MYKKGEIFELTVVGSSTTSLSFINNKPQKHSLLLFAF